MDGEELTEQETALYDRQIRVWGADAQRRLSKSHVLVYGMKSTVAEFCKNIVLAGVGSVTLVDDRAVTEEVLSSNFLIPLDDESAYAGKTLAELCCDSLKDFNPMVRVSVQKGDLASVNEEFFNKFDVVVVSCCPLATKKLINEKCRKLSKRVSFYAVDCRGSCGEIFVDLQNYRYAKKKQDETIDCELHYPSFQTYRLIALVESSLFLPMRLMVHTDGHNCDPNFRETDRQEATSVPWQAFPSRVSKLYFAMRVVERFEGAKGRNPGEIGSDDLPALLKLKKEICEAQSLNDTHIPNALLERLATNTGEFPPVCAIIGGILGQEVIKAISGKRDPLKNFFFFDAMDGKGVIEDISNPSKEAEKPGALNNLNAVAEEI